ncbi:DUF5667 domain-containing protein [Candidatus Pristimantibacillus sp. PTI5]|uniref:DUF5667 domain-containing protein n=1 Tax=Candidatus Pristimantibacillus sp. PTI5 TaxID=3400422 RepID=UPI003B01DB2E
MNQRRRTGSKRNTFIAKSALIGMLALGVGTGSVLASGEEPAPISSATIAADAPVVTAVTESTEKTDKTPNLLPGDFFYFIKSIYENIRLSITADNVKEAGLLAEFAQERLSEAAALHAKGETEKSEQALQKSFENQQIAIELVANEAEEENEGEDLHQAAEVKSDLQHNILALTSALEKVKNPQAQKSLLKNIIKSFGKLEKKLAKLENKAPEEQTSATITEQAEDSSTAKQDAVTSGEGTATTAATVTTSIESEAEQKTVSDKKTKLEKAATAKTAEVKEAKIKEAKIKERKTKETKPEKQEKQTIEQQDHKNNRSEKNHTGK